MQRELDMSCPRCGAVLIGSESCPDPRAHERPPVRPSDATPVCGGQVRTQYRVDAEGRALVQFRRWDGEVREFACYMPAIDPVTGARVPWLIAEPYLDADALYYVTGLSRSAFQGQSGFPGRIPGTRRVIVETTTFLREYVFGSMVRQRRWRRTSRQQKRARHTPECRRGCRKQHGAQ